MTQVCLGAKTLHYVQGGGHVWVYLNWALGLRALGCEVIWLEAPDATMSTEDVLAGADALDVLLSEYGLGGCLTLAPDEAADADLFLNFRYGTPCDIVARFRRSALIDIDPGLLQEWMRIGEIDLAPHDVHFTIGENVSSADGRRWHHTPPCVALDWWPAQPEANGASAFTSVTHWHGPQWIGDLETGYCNEKRLGFLPFLELAARVSQPLELALPSEEREAHAQLRAAGWRVRSSQDVASTPRDYQHYIQSSLGEFAGAKPSYVRYQNAWVSDRTLCYLASGKPAVVQHTGPSAILPDADGLFRFHTLDEATAAFAELAADYTHHCRAARALAEKYFDARRVVTRVLERALQ